jgi:hypothetical protein
MQIACQLYTKFGGALIADYSGRLDSLTFATNEHGFAEARVFVPMGTPEAFRIFDLGGPIHMIISNNSAAKLFEGRVEDIAITGEGVAITALGYGRALSDVPYTAFWTGTDFTNGGQSMRSIRPTFDPKCTALTRAIACSLA